jgi:predicted dinucleotide-binding enzyme
VTRVAVGSGQHGLAQGAAEQEQVLSGDTGAQNAGVHAAGAHLVDERVAALDAGVAGPTGGGVALDDGAIAGLVVEQLLEEADKCLPRILGGHRLLIGVVVSIPLGAYRQLPAAELAGKVVLDTSNYYATRDGHLPALDAGELTTSELVQQHLAGAKIVKAFNNISDHHIPALARPVGVADRTALPIAGDDPQAKTAAAELISRLGFDTVDAGPLTESWRFEPETDPYAVPYCADPDAIRAAWAQLAEALRSGTALQPPAPDPGTPLPAARLRTLLAGTSRKLTADRLIA